MLNYERVIYIEPGSHRGWKMSENTPGPGEVWRSRRVANMDRNWPGSCWSANGWNQWEAIGCKQGTAATRCGCACGACGAVEYRWVWCNSRFFLKWFVVHTIKQIIKWVCLKMGYIPNYSHLIGIMIMKTIGYNGVHYFQTNPLNKSLNGVNREPSINDSLLPMLNSDIPGIGFEVFDSQAGVRGMCPLRSTWLHTDVACCTQHLAEFLENFYGSFWLERICLVVAACFLS